MPCLRLSFLGAPEIELTGRPVHIGRRKAVALLAYLSVTGTGHSRDTLATLLWLESGQQAARAALRRDLSLLRQTLGSDWFAGDRNSIDLNRDAGVWTDVAQFQSLLSKARGQQESGAERAFLEEAVVLYRGDFLTGFSLRDCPGFDEWQSAHTESLRRDLAGALERLVRIGIERGAFDAALAHARRWLALDPLQEGAHRGLMQVYALSGRRTDALRQYQACVRVLDDELGVLPEEETTALAEDIRRRRFVSPRDAQQPGATETATAAQDPAQAPLVALPVGADERYPPTPSNLPVQPTSFVGRAQELSQILGRLSDPDCRLLTLVGPGGIGKTRLAIAVAARQERPAVYVPLQAVSAPERLAPAIADAAGITLAGPEPLPEQLLHRLRGQHLLLVLDNFEHLLAGTDLLGEIVQAAPEVKLLVTSREALRLREEWLYPVSGLPVPPQDGEGDPAACDAVRLFGERARQVRRAFRLDDENEAVIAICRAVGGMPLAIELAASWLAVLDCTAIAGRLHHSLDILTTPLRNVPERHRSIRAAFDGSWQMLSPEERDTFMQLAVFSGGFTLRSAGEVAGATLPILSALVAKTLVRREAEGRYQIHELLRQYAGEKLAASPARAAAAHRAHSDYFMRFLADRRLLFLGPRQRQVTREIGDEMENVRQAWQWAVEHLQTALIGRSGWALHHICQFQSRYREGAELFLEASRRLETDQMTVERGTALVATLTYYAWLCIRLGRLADADRALTRAHHLCAEFRISSAPDVVGHPLSPSVFLALARGDYEQATHLGEQILSRVEQHPRSGVIVIYYGLAEAALAQDDHPCAKAYAVQGLALADAAGNRRTTTFLHGVLGQVALAEGDLQTAQRHFAAAHGIFEELEEPGGIAEHLANLAGIALLRQAWPEATRLFRRSHRLYQEIGDRGGIARTQLGIGMVSQQTGEPDAAARCYRRALAVAVEAQVTPVILSVLAAVGDFLLADGETQALGLRVLSFVLQHPSCDAQVRRRVLDSLARCGVAAHELDPTADTLADLIAALQTVLGAPPEDLVPVQPRLGNHEER